MMLSMCEGISAIFSKFAEKKRFIAITLTTNEVVAMREGCHFQCKGVIVQYYG